MSELLSLDHAAALIRESQEARRQWRETLDAVEAQMHRIRVATDPAVSATDPPARIVADGQPDPGGGERD